jgi:PAS domain S-box-containing protein
MLVLTGSQFAQFTKVLDDLPDVVMILNREGCYLYVNRPAAKILGRCRQEIVGKSWRELARNPDVMGPVMASVQEVYATGEPVSFETVGTSSAYYEVVLTPFRPDGLVSAVVMIAHDITEIRDELERTRLLQDVAVATTSWLTPEDMASAVLESLRQRMRLDKGDVRMLDVTRERLRILAHVGYPPETIALNADAHVADSPLLTAEAFRQQRILTHEDENLTPERIAQIEQAGVSDSRYIVAPLIVRGETVGTMALTFEGKRPFSESEMELFSSVARIVAQGVSLIRTADQERRVSRSLQEATLILPSHIDGVRFGAMYRPATEGALIGGDFYHVFPLGDGAVGLFIGDVAGKGIKVADLMVSAKSTLRAHMYEGLAPAEVLSRTNAFLYQVTEPEMFTTAFVGCLDRRTGVLTYASGGHPAAFLRRADGTVERLEATGALVGALSESGYRTCEVSLGQGDVLILYTDGIIETKGESGMLGEEGLEQIVARASGDPAELPSVVVREVDRWAIDAPHDDAAVLAVGLDAE